MLAVSLLRLHSCFFAARTRFRRQLSRTVQPCWQTAEAIPPWLDQMANTFLTCSEGTSNKFYEVIVNAANQVMIRYGARGSNGIKLAAKDFDTPAAARAFASKTVLEKLKKGYVIDSDVVDSDRAAESLHTVAPLTVDVAPAAGKKRSAKEAGLSTVIATAVPPKKDRVAAALAILAGDSSAASAPSRRSTCLAYTDGASDKFYEVSVLGSSVEIRYGRRLTLGLTVPAKAFGSDAEANAFADKLIKEKRKKGYVDRDDGLTRAAPPASATVAPPASLVTHTVLPSPPLAPVAAAVDAAPPVAAPFLFGEGHMAIGQVVEVRGSNAVCNGVLSAATAYHLHPHCNTHPAFLFRCKAREHCPTASSESTTVCTRARARDGR